VRAYSQLPANVGQSELLLLSGTFRIHACPDVVIMESYPEWR
jgi:hypothetical protein